jgi:hypothetical protein
MKHGKNFFVYLAVLALFGILLGVVGCAKQDPVSPGASGQPPQFLKHKSRPGLSVEATFYAEKFVKAEEGWKISIGDDIAGYSTLAIPPKALRRDTQIQFSFTSAGEIGSSLSDVTFGPDGTQFRRPVLIGISYKDADLTGVNEKQLGIYYFNEEEDEWEKIPSRVDSRNKVVYAYVYHFSRYAVALSR